MKTFISSFKNKKNQHLNTENSNLYFTVSIVDSDSIDEKLDNIISEESFFSYPL